jgi:hypothetical protein
MRKQKVLDRMVASITRIQSPLHLFLNRIWFVTVVPNYFKLWHIFKWFICYFHIKILTCILVNLQHDLVFFMFISRPTSLLASIKVSMFFILASMLSPSKLASA